MPRTALEFGCATLALMALTNPASAQQTGDSPPPTPVEAPPPAGGTVPAATETRTVYVPADFARFAPRTALDMLQQVPGFSIQDSSGGRGLGEATGNVLLNGERISSKSDSVTQRLNRIAAANVVRIEFVDGATLDIAGLSGRVANIVTRQSADMSGQFEWTPQLSTGYTEFRWAAGRVSVAGTRGPVAFTVALDNSPFYGGAGGPNLITDANGITERYYSRTQSVTHNPKISTQLRIDGPGSSVGNFSAAHQWSWDGSKEDEHLVVAPGAPSPLEQIRGDGEGHNYELSGDFEFAFGPGRLKVIGLEGYRQTESASQTITDPDTGAAPRGRRFVSLNRSGERIARAEYRWKMFGGDFQLSAEGAFNRLNTSAELFTLSGGAFVPVQFPSGSGGVTEDRYESILSFGRPLASNLSLQISAGGEYSKLAQSGADARSRTFRRPKGAMTLAWAARPDLDVSLRIARRVGQLNFGDFLADVNLQNDNTNESNNELRPQQSWEFELEAVKDFGAWGSATLSVFQNRLEDYVTVVPLAAGGEAVGNIDSAKQSGVTFESTLRLDQAGFRGAKFDFDAQLRRSEIVDPLTGVTRQFDRSQPYSFNIQFRHDVPASNWAYGGSFRRFGVEPYHRRAEIGYDWNIRNALSLFLENKNVFGLTVQARVNNLLQQNQALDRTVYAGPRHTSPVLFREYRQRELGRIASLTVKGNF